MRLNTKLVAMMITLLVIAILILFVLNERSQNDLVKEIQESSTEVSKAIQLSVEDLTSDNELESSRLKEYLAEAKTKGINEINIINSEGEIINSSDPSKVGKKQELKKIEPGLKAARGGRTIGGLRPYELLVPVIVGDEQLGYVHINLLLDNIRVIQHENFLNRLLATSLVFMIGIVLTVFLARRYTEPIHRLVDGVRNVTAGDLTVAFPVATKDEIGQLGESLNEMVEKLREREILEKRLYEAEHLSKVGQLASGIAHEIRNPLNYISLAVDHLKGEVVTAAPERPEIVAIVDKIKEEVRRANYMVVNFMSYGRPLRLRISRFSYRELLERILPLLAERLEEQRVTVTVEVPDDLPPLRADREMLRNCIINMITNAAQAMPEGGEVRIGARYDAEAELFSLTFADTGNGISPEDLQKIFQPYFTTREAGIGLGLAVTERIVREHGGEIQVESTPGKGTLFTITLPSRDEGDNR